MEPPNPTQKTLSENCQYLLFFLAELSGIDLFASLYLYYLKYVLTDKSIKNLIILLTRWPQLSLLPVGHCT